MEAVGQMSPSQVLKLQKKLPRGARLPCQATTLLRGQVLVAAAAVVKALRQLPRDSESFMMVGVYETR
jgi:hypothetical protein